jgi:hypothetical protein
MPMNRRQLLFASLTPLLACVPRELPTSYTDSRRRVWELAYQTGDPDAFCDSWTARHWTSPTAFGWACATAPNGPWDALPELIRRIEATQ